MAEENDARLRFFLIAEDAIVIDVEQAQYCFVSSFPVAVLKDLNRVAFRKVLSNPLRKFHGSVVRIIVAHKAARKTDDDIRQGCGRTTGHCTVRGPEQWARRREDHERCNQNQTSRKARHAGSSV